MSLMSRIGALNVALSGTPPEAGCAINVEPRKRFATSIETAELLNATEAVIKTLLVVERGVIATLRPVTSLGVVVVVWV